MITEQQLQKLKSPTVFKILGLTTLFQAIHIVLLFVMVFVVAPLTAIAIAKFLTVISFIGMFGLFVMTIANKVSRSQLADLDDERADKFIIGSIKVGQSKWLWPSKVIGILSTAVLVYLMVVQWLMPIWGGLYAVIALADYGILWAGKLMAQEDLPEAEARIARRQRYIDRQQLTAQLKAQRPRTA